MPSNSWDLALAELIYYIPATVPILYCLWRHRSHGRMGWFFFFAFISLQVVGSGMTLSVGQNGTPSATAILVTSVGVSPLLLGLSGIIHEWVRISGLLTTKKSRKLAWVVLILHHVAVAGAIAIYALGSSHASNPATAKSGETLAKVGIILLLLLWFVQYMIFGLAAKRLRPLLPCAPLFWSIAVVNILLGIRLIYSTIATFEERRGAYNPVTGSIVLRVIFEFLPGALVVLVAVVGGVMSLHHLEETVQYDATSLPAHQAKEDQVM